MTSDDGKLLGKLLKELWESRGYSMRGLAKESGISRESLRLYGKGERLPSNKAVTTILQCVDMDMGSAQAKTILSHMSIIRGQHLPPVNYIRDSERKINLFVELFFTHSSRERTESFEYFLRQKFKEIEESE